MGLSEKMMDIFYNWDKDAFRAAHHPDYIFVREFEMVTLDKHIEIMDRLKRQVYYMEKTWQVIHAVDHVAIICYDEGEETVNNVSLI